MTAVNLFKKLTDADDAQDTLLLQVVLGKKTKVFSNLEERILQATNIKQMHGN